MTAYHNNYDLAVKNMIDHVGKTIVLGVPLGIGKPIGILNAIYRLASEDKSIQLTILTGLTLARPRIHSDLEKKFIEPILERILGDYEDLLYEKAREEQRLPSNIKVIEFFLAPGKYLKNKKVQQDYISTNYANATRDIINHSINVIAQQVVRSSIDAEKYSLSSNPDLFHEIAQYLGGIESSNKKIAILAEVNSNLPFMPGDAVVDSKIFTDIVDTKKYKSLFAIPKPQLSIQDHLIGLYTSALIKDDGCLQLGIGKLGDAITYSLILRHKHNSIYQDVLKKLNVFEKFKDVISKIGSTQPFDQGLYASTEMLTEGCLHLYKEKILKKQVYDHPGLQRLLNAKEITENITSDYLDILLKNNIINSALTQEDFNFLQQFGIIKSNIVYENQNLILSTGEKIHCDLIRLDSKNQIIEKCLGDSLKSGVVIHAGFFIGSNEFYQTLKNLPPEELNKINMTAISRVNTLSWSHELAELQRQNARLMNASMMVTVEGTVISDGLENWQEVSGIGGQFDFANMAQKLSGARFIINCHSTRRTNGKVHSNILWKYANTALARNLRDIIITEYGIADCRSKTDSEIIQAILNITDSRFQEELLSAAKKFGKIPDDYKIPEIFQNNTPDQIEPIIRELQTKGYFISYPFGSELTEEEQLIAETLLSLKNASKLSLLIKICKSLLFFQNDSINQKYLQRMKLDKPKTLKEYFAKKLLKFLISKSHRII